MGDELTRPGTPMFANLASGANCRGSRPDLAETVDGLRHHRLYRRPDGDVGGDGKRLAAECENLCGHRLDLDAGPGGQRYAGSFAGQCQRGCPTNAAAGAGDDRGLVLQSHRLTPCNADVLIVPLLRPPRKAHHVVDLKVRASVPSSPGDQRRTSAYTSLTPTWSRRYRDDLHRP